MGLFKGKKKAKTEAEQVAEDYNIIGKDKRIHPDDEEEEEDEEDSIPEPEPEPEPELRDLDVAALKMKCASLGLKQSGAREELIMRIEEATHESEEEPDVIAEDAEKAVHRTFEGKKARKKQWSGGRDSRTIRAEKEFAAKEKERLARDAERLAREAAKPKLLEALAPVKRKGGCFNACYDRYVLGLGKYKHVDYSEFTPYLNDFAHLGLKEPDVCRLLNIFLKIDSDRSGYMDSFEFLMWADIERSPFAEKIFKIFDHDLSGELDFVEFVCAIWNFCTMDDADVVSFAFECFGDRNPVTKEWWLQQEGVDLLTQSIFDVETQAYKTCKVFFDDIIMRNGKVTERDWTKWTQHNRRALRPLIDLRNKMRRQIVGKKWWKKLMKFRKKQFFRMRFHDIEKAIDSKRRQMNRKPLAQQKEEATVEKVFASRRTRESRGSFDNANEHARQREEERLAKRQKPKRKKFKIVMMHGYEQSVPWTDDDDNASPKKQPSVERPIEIKRKTAKLKKRNHDEKIALLKSLRSGSAAHDFNRRRSPSKRLQVGSAFLDAAKMNGSAARAAARLISKTGRPKYETNSYSILSEPSELERASGIYTLGGMIPTGDVVEQARALGQDREPEVLRLEYRG